ncbi:hypothetical protein CCACVL1_10665 [Corchorus capsularis]|uniref:Uncharacterized protein n=1 Tax=Corchorus capsularis TaxID=210143 RepID=A0A1R3IQC2_COCAP|nr:hypothetical protein CCACVL1_10665 [Corchorus capsularis]
MKEKQSSRMKQKLKQKSKMRNYHLKKDI